MGSFEQDGMPLQRSSLAAYLSLTDGVPVWSRRLVMLAASVAVAPWAPATLAAGGAVLWTCEDEALLRESSQAGLIDFQVTTLSEALRILKNEIRKGLPVSVGVLDAERTVWAEAAERGVQPQALLGAVGEEPAATVLLQRGATRLQSRTGMALQHSEAANWRDRRAGDAALLAMAERLSEPERAVALRWLRSAPQLFPRDRFRCYAKSWAASKDDR